MNTTTSLQAKTGMEHAGAPQPIAQTVSLRSRLNLRVVCFVVAHLVVLSAFFYYAYLWASGLHGYWFNPEVTSDDAMQQSFMFHEIRYPGRFAGDLITQAMQSYLAPLHYWLTYLATYLSGSPIMGGHWIMAVQFGSTLLCLFFASLQILKRLGIELRHGSLIPALCTAVWFLHSRHIWQRLTGGLPRGWAAPILTATICFALYGNHYAVLLVLLLGCLSNPPSTIIAALFYGLLLIWRSLARNEGYSTARRQLVQYIALSPLYILVAYWVSTPPDFLGTMATYSEALENPAFSRAGGRFAFVPLISAWLEIKIEGFFAFISHYEGIPEARLEMMPYLVLAVGGLLAVSALVLRKRLLPAEPILFLIAIAMVYFASRPLAFYLYVPDRHLRLPLGFFFLLSFPAALWALALPKKIRQVQAHANRIAISRLFLGIFLLSGLAGLVYSGSNLGLRGHANFNTTAWRKGPLFDWLREKTPSDSLVAGHPSHIDDTMLFAVRKAYITAETAHPFYDKYYQEVERRLRIVWQAYYAGDLETFYQLLRAEGIDYFVFRRNDFSRHTLAKATYYQPFTAWVAELASKHPSEYAFHKFPLGEPHGPNPILPFRDRHSIVVNMKELGQYLGHE